MSILSSSTTLSSLDESFSNKIKDLRVCDEIRGGWAADTVEEFGQISKEVEQLQHVVTEYRGILTSARNDLASSHSMLHEVAQLSARLAHMKANLPAHLPNNHSASHPVQDNHSKKQPQNTKDNPLTTTQDKVVTKPGLQKTRCISTFTFITVEEFETVPKYIRGRLQYDQVNAAISEMNRTLEAKYSLLARPRNKLSEADMTIVRNCKRQESNETKGVYFVVGDDIKRWSTLRLDPSGRSLLTIMRTLKRLREVRGPGNLVRFAVI